MTFVCNVIIKIIKLNSFKPDEIVLQKVVFSFVRAIFFVFR